MSLIRALRTIKPLRILSVQARSMSHSPKIISTEEFQTKAKWLKLENIKWQDQEGKERAWEVANRSTCKGEVDSCHILAIVHGEEDSILLIEQYRPPAGGYVVEFPAGLVDEGEDGATTALRELHEETGYDNNVSKVRSVSPVLVKDPGMTGANMYLVTIDIDGEAGETKLEPGEHIVKKLVPVKDLHKVLKDYAERGFAIDALVASVAAGLSLASGK